MRGARGGAADAHVAKVQVRRRQLEVTAHRLGRVGRVYAS